MSLLVETVLVLPTRSCTTPAATLTVTVPLANEQAVAAVNKLIDALEDHDDVKEVYSNAEQPDDEDKS